MPFFNASDGLRIAYYEHDFSDPWTKADTVVMLHSAMGRAGRFHAMVPAIARHFRVVLLDMRGHGSTQVPPAAEPLTNERLVQDVIELLDLLKIDRAHILGNSAGGYVAQHMAMDHPARVKSILLFASTAGLKHSQAGSWVPAVQAKGLRPHFAETIADRFPVAEVAPAYVEWFLDDIARNDTAFIGKWVLHFAAQDWSDRLHRVQCPTLIVAPGAEPVGSLDNYGPMRRNIKDHEWIEYDGARHNICDYMPDRCAADALAFLGRRFGGVNPRSPRNPA
jgi:pimeloyl-ACP methyl ester carboxylesterase